MPGFGRKRIPCKSDSVFSKNLHELMDGERFADLAAKIGVHPETINRYLNHAALPRGEILIRICKLYGVPLDILITPLARVQARESAIRAIIARFRRFGDFAGFHDDTERMIGEYEALK